MEEQMPQNQPKKGNPSLWIVLILVALIAVAANLYFGDFFNTNTNSNTNTSVNTNLMVNENTNTSSLIVYSGDKKTFSNSELGMSFEYPIEWGEYEFATEPGETGQLFRITFSSFSDFSAGGVNSTYTAGRDGTLLDAGGFVEENNNYYFKLAGNENPMADSFKLEPLEVMTVSGQKILLIDDKGFMNQRWDDSPSLNMTVGDYGAVINLPDSNFSGLAFSVKDSDQFSLEQFKELLSSLFFE